MYIVVVSDEGVLTSYFIQVMGNIVKKKFKAWLELDESQMEDQTKHAR